MAFKASTKVRGQDNAAIRYAAKVHLSYEKIST